MRYLIYIIAFIVAFYFIKQGPWVDQDIEDVITGLDKIENSETVDELVEHTESFNKEATRQFPLLKAKAKSPASIEFVDLTEKQNTLSEKGMAITREMQPLLNSLTPEVVEDQEKLTAILIPLCANLSEYIPVISEILLAIKTKSDLVNEHPIISTELMEGQHDKAKEIMSLMVNSQIKVFEEEKQAYANLQCDSYLALNE